MIEITRFIKIEKLEKRIKEKVFEPSVQIVGQIEPDVIASRMESSKRQAEAEEKRKNNRQKQQKRSFVTIGEIVEFKRNQS